MTTLAAEVEANQTLTKQNKSGNLTTRVAAETSEARLCAVLNGFQYVRVLKIAVMAAAQERFQSRFASWGVAANQLVYAVA